MMARLLRRLSAPGQALAHSLHQRLRALTKPAAAPLVASTLADLTRSKSELLMENALLHQQVIILRRSVKRPRCTASDRALLALFASRLRTRRQALLIVQPETVLRWHRELFRPLYAFFVIELASRRVVHVGVTRHPSDTWVAQQLREATPFGHHPKHLLTDNNSTYGPLFAHVATATGIEHIRTAYRVPLMNAIVERFLGSVRRECLDHVFALSERQLLRVLRQYVAYFNSERPHQGLQQRIPDAPARSMANTGPVCATPVLGGLHHSYHRAA
jgi:transposase InsO family protein